MKKIIVITPADARNGFACCGAVQYAVQPGEAVGALERVMADADNGVVILDERLVSAVGEEQLRAIEKQSSGVLVVLPSPGRISSGEDYAVRLIRRAVGYHVRVRT
jgi:vacuolar-type H+-ATPase subunit F/Vma7